MRRFVIILGLALAPAATHAQEMTLAEVLEGATVMGSPGPGYLTVVRPDGAYLCALNLDPTYFAALATGSSVAGRKPEAICIPASDVQTIGE